MVQDHRVITRKPPDIALIGYYFAEFSRGDVGHPVFGAVAIGLPAHPVPVPALGVGYMTCSEAPFRIVSVHETLYAIICCLYTPEFAGTGKIYCPHRAFLF